MQEDSLQQKLQQHRLELADVQANLGKLLTTPPASAVKAAQYKPLLDIENMAANAQAPPGADRMGSKVDVKRQLDWSSNFDNPLASSLAAK